VLVERALDRLLRGRTSLVVAHRLATVQRADEILVVEHGRVVQRGLAAELLQVDGPFRRLATVQRADEILVVEHGRVVQRGSARALLAVDGPFRRLATADVVG
jgi:ABC-type multidrug transport system fused ATPase/permease subunit